MNVIFTTDNTTLFIDAFFAPRFDQHVRVYRRHKFAVQIAADAARPLDDVAAGLRALRSRKLSAEGTPMMNDSPAMPHHADREDLARQLEVRADAFRALGFNALEIAQLIRSTIVRGPDVPGLGRDYSNEARTPA